VSDRMEELFELARAMGAEARTSFLAEACRSDARLERELTSLLAHAEPAESFFAGLAEAVVSPAVGHRVGHYRLVGTLGSGGMGTVYRAHDTRLDRVVALKFLPPHLSAEPEARERFLVEARAAAALEHPNLCSIHAIGDTDDGRPFIAMTCYEGETLKERLSRGPLAPAEAIGIAVQLASGLRAAHARGIVHRDVKPANIMLCADGTVRLLDFGVAKLADLAITGPGVTPGTIAYMSPEQARGDPVNHLTDLWSLGVVLYETISGVRPFRGANDRSVIQAILHEHPKPLKSIVGEALPFVPRIVERLLRKTAEERYQSAEELLVDLSRGSPAGRKGSVRAWVRAHTKTLTVSGAVLLAGLALLSLTRPAAPSGTGMPPPDLIAVLPFTVRGPDLEVWREGMVDLLSLGLDGAAGIRAVDSRTLLARWHQEVGDTTVGDLARALGVARRSQARYALVGSAVAAGRRVRLGADVYDVESGRVIGPVQVEGPSDSVLALVDRLGMQTLGVVLKKQTGEIPALDLAGVTTTSLIALKAYLEGEDHYRRSEFREASEAWERAVHADTLFALAHLALADSYGWYGEKGPQRSRDNLERARILAHRLPARERTLLQARWAGYTGAPDAVPTIREAIRKYPDAAEAWFALGEVYFHQAVALGRPREADQAFRRAAELRPTMAPYRRHLLDLAFIWNPDSAHVAHELEAYGRLAPEASGTRAGRIALALAFGEPGARADARARLATLDSESAFQVYPMLAHPRFSEVRGEVFPVLDPRFSESGRIGVRDLRFRTIGLMEGRARDALATLSEPSTPSYFRYCGPLYLSVRGMPVPERTLRQSVAAARTDRALLSNWASVACAAAAAARLGDWSEASALVSGMRANAARALAAGDSADARKWDWAVRVAEAYELWRRGRNEEALHAFEHTLEGDTGWFTLWNVGQLSLELGRLDQAERAFRALWRQDGTPAYLPLARILERTGRPAEAREAYQFVATAWQHADPELQPAVERARRAVTRLSSLGARPPQRP
jgi:tetratricopeptide (TPR) repeat protein